MILKVHEQSYSKGHHGALYRVMVVLLLLLVISLSFIFYQDTKYLQVTSQQRSVNFGGFTSSNSSIPLLIIWTTGNTDWRRNLKKYLTPLLQNCVYRCELIHRKEHGTLYRGRKASAYIFHSSDIKIADLPTQTSDHLNILFTKESPYYSGNQMYQMPLDYFNATITYRRDSRYFYPYGRFVARTPNDAVNTIITEDELFKAVKRKKKGALIIVSNCKTPSKREHVIRQLGNFTEITVRGRCEAKLSVNKRTMSASCKSDCSHDDLIATHRFYISFENADCNDYITEKYFMRISQLLLPVVRKRRIYEAAGIPSHSFIAADDFRSLEDLGNYLNFLRKNDTAYLRYFEWTRHFRKPYSYKSKALCELCEDIYKKERLMLNDIKQYYYTNQCFN